MKKFIPSVICVFVVWVVMGFLLYGVILSESYKASENLWRPPDQMKTGLVYAGTLVWTIIFVTVYAAFFRKKGPMTGLLYGLLLGIGIGFPMGFNTYASMPLPVTIATGWFVGTVIADAVGGLPDKVLKKPHPAASFVARVFKDDLIAIDSGSSTEFLRVAGFSTTNNKLDVKPPQATDAPQTYVSINVLGHQNLRRLHVTPDGRVLSDRRSRP